MKYNCIIGFRLMILSNEQVSIKTYNLVCAATYDKISSKSDRIRHRIDGMVFTYLDKLQELL